MTTQSWDTAPTHETHHLAGRLPAMPEDVAALCRIVFDARFAPWLSSMLGGLEVRVTAEPAGKLAGRPVHPLQIDLRCNAGRVGGIVDASQSGVMGPVATLASQPDGAQLAASVVNALLTRFARLSSMSIEGLDVCGVAPPAAQPVLDWPMPVLQIGAWRIHSVRVDPPLALNLADALNAHGGVGLHALTQLPLPVRVSMGSRTYPLQVLHTLSRGDVVLVQPDVRVVIGCGVCLAAPLHIDLAQGTVYVRDSPVMRVDDAPIYSPENDPMNLQLSDLQVPVAFEIDTTRLSLDELASMAPGYVIAMDVPLQHAPVRLVCQGQQVGAGQLIAIGDRLGVRIERMQWTGHARD